jgi:magnesium transporter
MKALAMVSTVILPMSLVTGIYGMNFERMPEIKWVYGYPLALGVMAVVATVALGVFYWKKWL